MDFAASEATRDLAALTSRVFETWNEAHPVPHNVSGVREGFDAELWARLESAGVLDAALPRSVGGGGFGLEEQCAILTACGRFDAAVPYLASIAVGATAIAEFGTPAQIERWVVPVVSGTATLATALGAAGPDVVIARRGPEGLAFDGTCPAVTAAADADAFLVEALFENGAVLALVDRESKGLRVSREELVDGDDAALLEFEGVGIPADAVLDGPDAAAWVHRRQDIAWCARQLGVLDRALAAGADYARTREQFGKPIGSFQAVRQRLADAYIDVDAVRLALAEAVWREDEGFDSTEAVATAAFWAAEAGHRVAHTVVHIHGGVGIDTDHPTHRSFVAAKRAEFALGGATTALRRIGRRLADA
ncbi:acyl-CoA/acyl-ACP dehydrogenase [Tsukamurella sp. 8F]|uniref:acyl-CoA dehydrogenase family protein n=1 Tax=unclassified Tsukamurella TaxID=2633480 RepID=UPI0023B96D5A|nr:MULTISPECIES: acyl-CoA dehydrogenase family protein [unclassified Tsukamurella]MDF0530736.1 acyl-CoA/acyl-ACP dehydrogenase [Tsukamurella sp. 8J]MDF0587937.1 acyl-CoA/acyl-ACP dehydrogenase [Tsukamurella sp. 8F]